MTINTKLLDLETIEKELTYAKLWDGHRLLVESKEEYLALKENAIYRGALLEAVAIEQQLYYLSANIDTLEVAMLLKENDAFEFTDYEMICKN